MVERGNQKKHLLLNQKQVSEIKKTNFFVYEFRF